MEGNPEAALPLVGHPRFLSTPLANYARYYTGVAHLALGHLVEAAAAFDAVNGSGPIWGYLSEALVLRRSELALVANSPEAALAALEQLPPKSLGVEDILLRIAQAADLAGRPDRALQAYRRLYVEFPLSIEAEEAEREIARLDPKAEPTAEMLAGELGRANRLFSARHYQPAWQAYDRIVGMATGDDRALAELRRAECDYRLRRFTAARDALEGLPGGSSRQAEARYFRLATARALKRSKTFISQVTDLVRAFPASRWAEEALNSLASYYIIDDEDDEADRVFRDMLRGFPDGRHAERATWRVGWVAYRDSRYREAARLFEEAAVAIPRADRRPAWLYWAGRAHEKLNEVDAAAARYRLAITDYQNSYYGRLATRRLSATGEPMILREGRVPSAPSPPPPPPSAATIRALIALGLFEDAMREVRYVQRVFGETASLQATVAWLRQQQGLAQRSRERFDNVRGAINQMKRAYPQYLTASGEHLPREVLGVVFPLEYWPLIKAYAAANDLDPYLLAALIGQESTFTPDIRSGANAMGLMQLLPATGRRYAKKLKVPFTNALLRTPEANVRLGTAYLKDLLDRFVGVHLALAGYNAGENRVARWVEERPGLEQDEFVDDIPFPETQLYVKKILSTTEDYRRLYDIGPGV
jgi:soluble lytic murein transglycosylase